VVVAADRDLSALAVINAINITLIQKKTLLCIRHGWFKARFIMWTTATTTMIYHHSKSDSRRFSTTVSTSTTFIVMTIIVTVMMAGFVDAWGEIGHEIVANLAWARLDDDPTLQMHLRKILNLTSSSSNKNILTRSDDKEDDPGSPLAVVANWADHVRHFLPWSGPLHFIDVQDEVINGGCHYHHGPNDIFEQQDNNDGLCMFYYARDCRDNDCVAGAILNYSSQLLPSHGAGRRHRQQRRRGLLRGHDQPISNNIINNENNNLADPYHQRQALMFLIQ
jgi:S1/P1 Nuclease